VYVHLHILIQLQAPVLTCADRFCDPRLAITYYCRLTNLFLDTALRLIISDQQCQHGGRPNF
jgi:hypothetical protein